MVVELKLPAERACCIGRSAACANLSESSEMRTPLLARTEGDCGWLQSGPTGRTRGIGSVFAGEWPGGGERGREKRGDRQEKVQVHGFR